MLPYADEPNPLHSASEAANNPDAPTPEPVAATDAQSSAASAAAYPAGAQQDVEPFPVTPTSATTPIYPSPFATPADTGYVMTPSPRTWWQTNGKQVLRVALLLVILVAGIGIGVVAAHGRGAATSATGSALRTSNSTVALPSTVQDLQQTIITVVHTVQPSVVEVQSSGGTGSAIGSGEFLTKDGYIVTNNHVVEGFTTYSVLLADGTTHAAQLVGQDAQDDLAVLKTDVTNATPITLADSSQSQIGQFVVAVGSPLGLQQSATFGIVSALNRTEQENSSNSFGAASGPVLTGLIQTSAPINPGNSGGALVDLQGRLIGIPTLGASGQQSGATISGIGFAIPSNRVKTVADQLMQQGHVTSTGQGFLGVQGQDVTPQVAQANNLSVQQGVLVQGFAADAHGATPAQSAGMHTGDVIVAVNGQTIANSSDLAGILLNLTPGTNVSLNVVRGTNHLTLHVKLGERPTASQG